VVDWWCPHNRGHFMKELKKKKRVTSLINSLKHLAYVERLQQLKLSTLKLRGKMMSYNNY